ncbi:MAG: hypothetical protein ABSE90_01050 [Verrucomicrobiota bacterium]|jgi:hypothetical protein
MNANLKWITILPLVFVCGCAGTALHHTFADYSGVYAQSMNEQLLLNLARLSQNEPPYFIQFSAMNANFTFHSSLTFSPSGTLLPDAAKNTVTLGGSALAEVTENPQFNFVPLAGEQFASAINKPISKELFFTLYDQGFHADLLMRALVSSVRRTNGEVWVNNPNSRNYAKFLKFCDVLYRAQLDHYLIVKKGNASESVRFRDAKMSDVVGAIGAGLGVTNAATSAGFTVTNAENGTNLDYVLTKSHDDVRFEFDTNAYTMSPTDDVFLNELKELGLIDRQTNTIKSVEVMKALNIIKNPFEDDVFQMRTFLSTMYAVAREEVYFKHKYDTPDHSGLDSKDVHNGFTNDDYGYAYKVGQTNFIRPILTMTGFQPKIYSNLTILVKEPFNKTQYMIADCNGDIDEHNNRVFSLLSLLFVDVAIDPKDLPVQQLIQVH